MGTPSAASLALAEPAGSSVTVSLDPATRSVAEGSSASFEAVLSGTVATAVVVSWKTADGTAGERRLHGAVCDDADDRRG